MHIAILGRNICPPWNEAVKNMAYELGQQLAILGHDVHLLTTNSKGSTSKQENMDFIDISSQAFTSGAVKALLKLQASEKLEVVHVQNLIIHRSLAPLLSALRKKSSLPIVAYCCQLPGLKVSSWVEVLRKDPREAFSSKLGMLAPPFISYWAVRTTSKAVASSEFIRARLTRSLPRNRVEIVPPFVQQEKLLSRPKPMSRENKPPRILYLGSHKALRGEEDFLLAMSLLKNEFPSLEGIAVTPHPLPGRIQSLVTRLKLDGSITFPSRNVPLDVLSMIESSDLYMFTGLSPIGSIDPPLTIVESMILGTPVVSYDTGGIGEILDKNSLVPYHDYVSLAKTASEILHNNGSKQPRLDLLPRFSSQNAAKQFERIYQEVA